MRVAWHLGLISAVLVASGPASSFAADAHRPARRHASGLNRLVEKRAQFENTRFTTFTTGLGACGNFNTASDFVSTVPVLQSGSNASADCYMTSDHCSGHSGELYA